MLEQLKYKNHLNEVFEFGKDGIYVNMSDIHDYEWNVASKGNRITSLNRKISKRKLPVVIICRDAEAGIAAKNRMLEVMEKDVLAMQHGQIIVGDHYFRCFVTQSQKKKYLTEKRYMEATLTLTSDFPFWVKETEFSYGKLGEISADGGKNLDFPYDHAFDYFGGIGIKRMKNPDFVSTNFRMVIHGQCENPTVFISGHEYTVNCVLADGESLTIDSINKTVTKTAADGISTNMFNNRNKESYIFEKIPSGVNVVLWSGNFALDIVLLAERSEPQWT